MSTSYPTTQHPLPKTPLPTLLHPISQALAQNYTTHHISIASPPDLRLPPYSLAAAGLSGSPCIADIGGQAHLAPLPNRVKIYSLPQMAALMGLPDSQGLILGAAAGPFGELGVNSELMPNMAWYTTTTTTPDADWKGKGEGQGTGNGEKVVVNRTRYARVGPDGACICGPLDTHTCGLMANLYGSEGTTGEVLHISASGTRHGTTASFTECVRQGLARRFGAGQQVSLGGVMLVKGGRVRVHVMPDFSETALEDRGAVEGWLRFFEMGPPLVGLVTLHSVDAAGLGLRMEHTHCFSEHGEGGHYHGDVEGEEVEYEAWLNVAERITRVDRPVS
ncbi:DUF1907-domain-containing protein [Pseudovirgaria hyperparasitica]|uniref:DUF1907-domain-containing protein n=1 Tax=Pseudovirgaria hyperparasitica TaxID=470096 RepID=A0A6A6VX69_9PEZI|nr:DUF1907-domain-containing protein [Pseudovirgaria hyperparasitica]KAF2754304.1 DUF1907-domain-containing protein [Pseudovirgaria hyperparasitica]